MTDVSAFWALQEIDIQPRISGMVTDESILTVDLPSTGLIDRHSGRPEAVRWPCTSAGNQRGSVTTY